MCGLVPYTGSLTLHGKEVRCWKPRSLATLLALVRQTTPLSFDFTVQEVVSLGRSPHKGLLERDTRRDRTMVDRALERVDLAGFGDRSIHSLSGGESRRAFLAQALVQDAELLLLDEPTSHLDVHHQFRFLHLLRELVDSGRTTVVVFHDIELAARFSDVLFILRHGRLAAAGSPDDVLTTGMIASVFRMRSTIMPNAHISYIEPLY